GGTMNIIRRLWGKPLKVLLRKENRSWVAQCVDYDIAAQGETVRAAMSAFHRTLKAQVMLDIERGREPLKAIPAAPEVYAKQFDVAEPLREEKRIQVTLRRDRLPFLPLILPLFLTEEFRVTG